MKTRSETENHDTKSIARVSERASEKKMKIKQGKKASK
jgi:hypothetical protein